MREIIILGRGQSRNECPFDAEVWAAASLLSEEEWQDKGYSKVFAFDRLESSASETIGVGIARERNIPIVSTLPFGTERYPLEEIEDKYKTDYLRNDASYMIALAIYLGYQKIRLYGIDQGPEWMYLATKPYVTFWLGVAKGMGIEYEIAHSSILMQDMDAEYKERMKEEKVIALKRFKLDIMPHIQPRGEVSYR